MTGDVKALPDAPLSDSGLRLVHFFDAEVVGIELALNDVHLAVEWSQFRDCDFHQRVRPVLNEQGFSAQGSFGNSPAFYRNCVFRRVRFKQFGGFNLGRGWFENCHFIDCRWEGHFATKAALLDCTFSGRMNGCAWSGRDDEVTNTFRGSDFTQVQFTDNVAWRDSFPLADQRWPQGFVPLVDD